MSAVLNFDTGRARDHVILLDSLDFLMHKYELEKITKLHNHGMHYKEIAKATERNPYEVILALLHQVRNGKYMLPMAYVIKEFEEEIS